MQLDREMIDGNAGSSALPMALSERLNEDGDGKPLTWFPGSTSSATRGAPRLCEEVKERIAGVEPDSLRHSRTFDAVVRARVKRDADDLMEQFAGYFTPPVREVA